MQYSLQGKALQVPNGRIGGGEKEKVKE